LVVWTSIIYRQIQTVHVTAPGSVIGQAGGLLASASLSVCGLVSWTMANTADLADPAISKVLSTLAFVFGGPGFVAMFGLLLAGVSISGLSTALMPRPVA
jgi:hypothetical protein